MQTPYSLHRCAPGPWGEIEYFFTFLDPPSSYFDRQLALSTTQWFFRDFSCVQVRELFARSKIDFATISPSWVVEASNGVLIRPPDHYLESLPLESLQNLQIEILRRFGDDSGLGEFIIENGDFAAFTSGLDLPEDLIRWTQKRCFKWGRRTVFADTRFALSRIQQPELKVRFLRALSRTRSMIARLRITRESDLKRIAEWWSAGPNYLRPLPLLEAALATGGVETVDLIHLLPPGAKRVLNTFSLERDCLLDQSPDCYWAAMNFFQSAPSNRFLDTEIPRNYYFVDRFEKVPKATRFGDVFAIALKEQNRFIHACVHIADDIVYTKNGSSKFYPYVLMNRQDMMTRYLPEGSYVIEVFRMRPR